MLLVTTTLPGDRGVSRCQFCRTALLVDESRLPRLRSGEDMPWCDECIPAALAACGTRRRRASSSPVPSSDQEAAHDHHDSNG